MTRPAVYVRLHCPLCGRHVAGLPDAEGHEVQLVKHMTASRTGAPRTWCAASERVVTRRAGGWRLEERP